MIGKALEAAAATLPTGTGLPRVADRRLRQIIEMGGLCNAAEAQAVAAELLVLRAAQGTQPCAAVEPPLRVGRR